MARSPKKEVFVVRKQITQCEGTIEERLRKLVEFCSIESDYQNIESCCRQVIDKERPVNSSFLVNGLAQKELPACNEKAFTLELIEEGFEGIVPVVTYASDAPKPKGCNESPPSAQPIEPTKKLRYAMHILSCLSHVFACKKFLLEQRPESRLDRCIAAIRGLEDGLVAIANSLSWLRLFEYEPAIADHVARIEGASKGGKEKGKHSPADEYQRMLEEWLARHPESNVTAARRHVAQVTGKKLNTITRYTFDPNNQKSAKRKGLRTKM